METLHPVTSGTRLGGAWRIKDTSGVIPEGSEPLWSAGRLAYHPDGHCDGPMVSKVGSVCKKMQEEDISPFSHFCFVVCFIMYIIYWHSSTYM